MEIKYHAEYFNQLKSLSDNWRASNIALKLFIFSNSCKAAEIEIRLKI